MSQPARQMASPNRPWISHHAIQGKLDEQYHSPPSGVCPNCARLCRLYWPRGGDGTVRVTFWHKDPATKKWCRAEIDIEDVTFAETNRA